MTSFEGSLPTAFGSKPASARRYSSDILFQPFYGLSRYVRCLFVFYICVSLMYTLAHFYTLFHGAYPTPSVLHERTVVGKIVLDNTNVASNTMAPGDASDAALWTGHFSVVAQDKKDTTDPFADISQEALFSKMFQYALKPSKITPYYLRATQTPDRKDITITTLITIERLHVFNNLVERYQGPISVTLHLNDDEHKQEYLEQLQEMHQTHPMFAQYVDVHLVVDNYDRQFNLWRNIARFFARSDFVMTIDVDFLLCSRLRENMAKLAPEHWERMANGSAVFVVPAFEFGRESAEVEVTEYPETKSELMRHIEHNDLIMFHNKWKRGHGPTNYPRWMKATSPYKVLEFNYNYEPYVVMRRDGLPWCDERFVGYGSNKAACLYEIYLAGAEFWVLPDDFLIHQRHPYPENDRRVERKYNKRLYDAYREEACFRYSRMSAGVPNSTVVDERICGSNFPTFYGL